MLIGFLDSRVYLAVREVATIQYLFTDFLTLLPANTCIPRMPLKKIILHPEATGEHFYTRSANEKNFLIKNGWRYEGIAWYSDSQEEVPVYRDCKPSQARFSHNYTSNLGEHLILTATSAWRDEGIGWYGCK